MTFINGVIVGCAITFFVFYRKGKKNAEDLKKKKNRPEGSDKNLYEGDEDY